MRSRKWELAEKQHKISHRVGFVRSGPMRYSFGPMYTSVKWMNDYLEPPATAEEQAELLTRAGFPLEGREDVEGGIDVRQDFEMTSNRGDCVCHLGLAREIAAISDRSLKPPQPDLRAKGPKAETFISVRNDEPSLCPLYTARVIKGVTVQPSPDWLAARLRARGDIPRNNVVDLTNFVLFELGQPTHVFDLAKLAGPSIIVRRAAAGEPFLPLGEGSKPIELIPDDLVIADAERPVALAGVKGGAESAVTSQTTDLVLEAATFNPVTVRNTSRRHGISSDSSYRFERGVHPGQVHAAADRLAELILDLAGGELCEGVVEDGGPITSPRNVSMRIERCRRILGIDIPEEAILNGLERLGFSPSKQNGTVECIVPMQRLDIEREVDLIEEVGRMYGYDRIPIAESISITVAPPQPEERARRAVRDELVGMGFLETVTHSLIADDAAERFLPDGMTLLRLQENRSGAESALRPSIMPSLLRVYKHNRDNGVGDVKLFEQASVFARMRGEHVERENVGLLIPAGDGEDAEWSLRTMRGVLDRLIGLLRGPEARVAVSAEAALPWFEPCAVVRYEEQVLGSYGPLAESVRKAFDIDEPVICGEFGLPALYSIFPPEREVQPLPSFPAITRDVSAIVDEHVLWQEIEHTIAELNLDHLERIDFASIFRGKQIGAGRKSVTVRLTFRSPESTLKHEDVGPQMDRVVEAIERAFGAEIRR